MSLYERAVRPLLFTLDPERAHDMTVGALSAFSRVPFARRALSAAFSHADPSLETTVAGLRFPNPVGLAAGFDKDCRLAHALPALGFGFIELGTVTLRPQPGNPLPRIFRIPESAAVINRMGFPSGGAAVAAKHLERLGEHPVPIGVNLGLNKDVTPEQAPARYADAFEILHPFGDYFVVNVSSPNTAGLRRLQDKLRLERILIAMRERNPDGKPVFVKLAPDLQPGALEDLLPMIGKNASGVVCTNTTISEHLRDEALELAGRARHGGKPARGDMRSVHPPFPGGGLSGAPLKELSTKMIRDVCRLTSGRLPIIGVGGIFDAEDAYRKIRAGASLVQVYTGLVYRGPGLPGAINRGLAALLKQHGIRSVGDAVGRSHSPAAKEMAT